VPTVAQRTQDALAAFAAGKLGALSATGGLHAGPLEPTGVDARTRGLVRIAALIALDGPPTSYAEEVASAIEGGASPEEIVGVIRAVGSQVGGPRIVAAAPEIMLALGLSLPETPELG
jgi:alkylhydroperoxidase/carboxymuconolactone decarboxylase family protein YurZ